MSDDGIRVATNANRMINDLVHRRSEAHTILAEGGLDALLTRYALTNEERQGFHSGDWRDFMAAGVPPVLQILYALQASEEARHHLSWKVYEERFRTEILSGGTDLVR